MPGVTVKATHVATNADKSYTAAERNQNTDHHAYAHANFHHHADAERDPHRIREQVKDIEFRRCQAASKAAREQYAASLQAAANLQAAHTQAAVAPPPVPRAVTPPPVPLVQA